VIGFTMETARSDRDAYSWDVKTGKLERWTASELGGLQSRYVSRSRKLVFVEELRRARKSRVFLYKPDAARFPGKRPVGHQTFTAVRRASRVPTPSVRANYLVTELGHRAHLPQTSAARRATARPSWRWTNGFLREGSYKDIGALFDWIGTRADLDAGPRDGHGRKLRRPHGRSRWAYLYSDRIRLRDRNVVRPVEPGDVFWRTPRDTAGTCAGWSTATSVTRRCGPSSRRRPRSNNAERIKKTPLRDPGGQTIRACRCPSPVQMVQEDSAASGNPGLVPDGEGRRPRLREEIQPRLPVSYASVQFLKEYLLAP